MKVVLVALLALLVFAAVSASAAEAAPELLSSTIPQELTGSGEVGNLNTTGGNNVECKTNAVTGTQESTTLFLLHITFKTCSKGCKTTGAAAKEILIEVQGHIVLFTIAGVHRYGIWILNLTITLECTGLTVNVNGTVILPTTLKLETLTLTTTVEATQTSNGVQSITTCEEPVEAELCGTTAQLKAKFGTGLEENASEVQTDTTTFANEVEAVG